MKSLLILLWSAASVYATETNYVKISNYIHHEFFGRSNILGTCVEYFADNFTFDRSAGFGLGSSGGSESCPRTGTNNCVYQSSYYWTTSGTGSETNSKSGFSCSAPYTNINSSFTGKPMYYRFRNQSFLGIAEFEDGFYAVSNKLDITSGTVLLTHTNYSWVSVTPLAWDTNGSPLVSSNLTIPPKGLDYWGQAFFRNTNETNIAVTANISDYDYDYILARPRKVEMSVCIATNVSLTVQGIESRYQDGAENILGFCKSPTLGTTSNPANPNTNMIADANAYIEFHMSVSTTDSTLKSGYSSAPVTSDEVDAILANHTANIIIVKSLPPGLLARSLVGANKTIIKEDASVETCIHELGHLCNLADFNSEPKYIMAQTAVRTDTYTPADHASAFSTYTISKL